MARCDVGLARALLGPVDGRHECSRGEDALAERGRLLGGREAHADCMSLGVVPEDDIDDELGRAGGVTFRVGVARRKTDGKGAVIVEGPIDATASRLVERLELDACRAVV
jgi:hypothetical protein